MSQETFEKVKVVSPHDDVGPEKPGDAKDPSALEEHKPSLKERGLKVLTKAFPASRIDPVESFVNSTVAKMGADSDDEIASEYGEKDEVYIPFVDKPWFALGTGLVIFLNAMSIGLDTDNTTTNISTGAEKNESTWYIVEMVFCIFFIIEIVLRLACHKSAFFTNPLTRTWNVVDFAIVVSSSIDTLILQPAKSGGSLTVITMLRMVRLMRLARLLRLLKMFKELWLIVSGILQSLKTLGWIGVVSFLFCLACGVLATVVIGHADDIYDPYFVESEGWDHKVYFASVLRSTFTMFQLMTVDAWSEGVVRHVAQKQPYVMPFLLLVVIISVFGLLTIIIGVVCENTLSTASRDLLKLKARQDKERKQIFTQLQELFVIMDADGSGTLSLDEVELAIQKPEIYNKLKMIDFPVDEPGNVFELLDYNNSGELTIEEFISGCVRMKGTAKSKDLLVAQVAVDSMRKQYALFEQEMDKLKAKIAHIHDSIDAVIGHGEHVFLDERAYRQRHPELEGKAVPDVTTMPMEVVAWRTSSDPQQTEDRLALVDSGPEEQLALVSPPGKMSLPESRRKQLELTSSPHSNSQARGAPSPLAIENGQRAIEHGHLAENQLAVPGSLNN